MVRVGSMPTSESATGSSRDSLIVANPSKSQRLGVPDAQRGDFYSRHPHVRPTPPRSQHGLPKPSMSLQSTSTGSGGLHGRW